MWHLTVHVSPPGPMQIFWLLVLALVSIALALFRHLQRRARWAEVLAGAHVWAASVGGTLERVSEQPAVYGYRHAIVARRYRVTFIDREGAECVATLRYVSNSATWELEKLIRNTTPDAPEAPASSSDAEQSADGYARRHRGKIANVPVIFAPPRRRKPPRRST